MNICELNNLKKKAVSLRNAGDFSGAASMAFMVQKESAKSHSKHAYRLECEAHAIACFCQKLYKGSDHGVKSELGRIAKMSSIAFQRGGAASRRVATPWTF